MRRGATRIEKIYLDPYMDLFNREIINYTISKQPNKQTMMTGLNIAIEATDDCPYRRTFHSDHGWGYQMPTYQQRLKDAHIFQSMSHKGNCLDNSPMENFFSIMKNEMFYGHTYHSVQELIEAIHQFIDYYNNKRIKERLGGYSPIEYRRQMACSVN